METVNNLTASASKLIWGEPATTSEGEEPISGETGDTSAEEPYDKGNEEENSTSATDLANPKASSTGDTAAASDPISESKAESTPSTLPTHSETSADNPSSTTNTRTLPSTGSSAQDTSNLLSSDKSLTEANSDEHARITETKREAGDAVKDNKAGVGGTVGNEANDSAPGVVEPHKGGVSEGTGESYGKSTSLRTDRNDFDASKPGAAQGADRLPATNEAPASTSTTSNVDSKDNEDISDSSSPSGSKLRGLKEKIKAKLHKNKD